MEYLPLALAGAVAFAVTLYVLLDGFSLGIGILFPFAPHGAGRRTMMATVVPVWDGNQTWLVFGGAILFAAFPPAFSALLQAFYLPLILMLAALVLRGAAIEFRNKGEHPGLWDRIFAAGCWVAAYCQGLVLGAYVMGESGGGFDWLAPFPLFCGIAVVIAYALLGSLWLALKTEGDLEARSRRQSRRLFFLALVCIAAISLWTPLASQPVADRWFDWPGFLLLSPVPVFTLFASISFLAAHARGNTLLALISAVGLFLLTLAGLAVSLWPWIVPRRMTLWEAAAAPNSLMLLAVGIAVILPWVLVYTAHTYYVFRGKVRAEDEY